MVDAWGLCGHPWWAEAASQRCCQALAPRPPGKPTEPTQKDSGLWRNAFPSLGACTVSSGRPWSAGPWRLEPIPLVRRPEQSPKPPENDTHQPLKPRWRQSSERRKALQPNYSRSIAVQENALRVMCTPWPDQRHWQFRAKAPQPNYSRSIAVQENALRVTWRVRR